LNHGRWTAQEKAERLGAEIAAPALGGAETWLAQAGPDGTLVYIMSPPS
jgi:hypothetical protein